MSRSEQAGRDAYASHPDQARGPAGSRGPRLVDRALWSLYARTYDGLLNFTPYVRLLEEIAGRVAPAPGMKVVDLGCGTGNLLALLRRVPGLDLVGVDSSAAMLRVAAKKLGASAASQVVLMRGEVVDFLSHRADAEFDRVVLSNVAYAVRDQASLWRQVVRVLRPEGFAVVSNPVTVSAVPIIREHLSTSSYLSLVRPRLLGVFLVDTLISWFGHSGRFDFVAIEALTARIKSAGGSVSDVGRDYGGTNVTFCIRRQPGPIASSAPTRDDAQRAG